jgi:hypothetical protein
MFEHHSNGTLTHLGGKLRGRSVIRHGSSLSRVGASDKSGAVHIGRHRRYSQASNFGLMLSVPPIKRLGLVKVKHMDARPWPLGEGTGKRQA